MKQIAEEKLHTECSEAHKGSRPSQGTENRESTYRILYFLSLRSAALHGEVTWVSWAWAWHHHTSQPHHVFLPLLILRRGLRGRLARQDGLHASGAEESTGWEADCMRAKCGLNAAGTENSNRHDWTAVHLKGL